jgi:hypothetical protein
VSQELASRITATGECVTLLWYRRSGRVAIEVTKTAEHGSAAVRAFVEPTQALDAFLHPFVHVDPAPVLALAAP